MEINKEILEILLKNNIRKDDGICYLISIYYNFKPDYIPDVLKQKIHTSKIFEVDSNDSIQWNIPLFYNQETKFEWVKTEYLTLFRQASFEKSGHIKESIRRMKKFFADNPDVRKDEVISATDMYLRNTDYRYIRLPHYFISKGSGVNKTSDLLDWIEKYRESEKSNVTTNIMQ